MGAVRSWCARASSGAVALLALTCALGVGASAAVGSPHGLRCRPGRARRHLRNRRVRGHARSTTRAGTCCGRRARADVAGGKLGLPIRTGDFIGGTPRRRENVVLQDAPRAAGPRRRGSAPPRSTSTGSRPASCCGRARARRTPTTRSARSTRSRPTPVTRRFEAIWTDGGGLAVPIPDSGAALASSRPADVSMRLRSDGRGGDGGVLAATARRVDPDRPARALRRRAARRVARDRRRPARRRRPSRSSASTLACGPERRRHRDRPAAPRPSPSTSPTVASRRQRARVGLRRRHGRRPAHTQSHTFTAARHVPGRR